MKLLRYGSAGRERPSIIDGSGTITSDLDMWLDVNGKRFQSGSTRTMIFKPAFLVAYLSQFMSLQPGDVVSTGTPPGVGMGQKPPAYLNIDDIVELSIARLGTQRQVVIAPPGL
jgi:2,4-didehydro-3-deoxy-L-rhamnonate hydrolase